MSDTVKEHATVEHDAPVAKRSKKHSCMRHCKRFWWIYLIVSIVVIVLVVCLIILVAVPKIAQHKIDDAELEIQGVNVLRTESEAYRMEINSTIKTDGKIKAKIDAFEGVMYLEDLQPHTPFVTINFPQTSGAKHQTVNVSQDVVITDMDAFRTFNIWFANNDTLRVTVEGKTKVKPSGLTRKYGVTFKKTLDIKGLNLFRGTQVVEEDSNILIRENAEGHNFVGIAEIPNQSVFTLDIGNASFINFVGDENLGSLYINDLLLVPGLNRVNISGDMDQGAILVLARTREYCDDGIMPFKLQGENVVNHGQELSYFAAGLASANQTVDINIGSIIEKDFGTRITCADD